MKTPVQPNPSGRRGGTRSAMSGALPYMSERQPQAYLMARDAIRRIQRTSTIVDTISIERARAQGAADGRFNTH